jgi:hypothetical protein
MRQKRNWNVVAGSRIHWNYYTNTDWKNVATIYSTSCIKSGSDKNILTLSVTHVGCERNWSTCFDVHWIRLLITILAFKLRYSISALSSPSCTIAIPPVVVVHHILYNLSCVMWFSPVCEHLCGLSPVCAYIILQCGLSPSVKGPTEKAMAGTSFNSSPPLAGSRP